MNKKLFLLMSVFGIFSLRGSTLHDANKKKIQQLVREGMIDLSAKGKFLQSRHEQQADDMKIEFVAVNATFLISAPLTHAIKGNNQRPVHNRSQTGGKQYNKNVPFRSSFAHFKQGKDTPSYNGPRKTVRSHHHVG